MRGIALVLGVLGACHSLAGREHAVLTRSGGAGDRGSEGGTDTDGSTAGFGGGEASIAGLASAGENPVPVGGQGGRFAGAGGEGGSDDGGQAAEPPCDDGSPCAPDARCWLGQTSCDHGIPACLRSEPAPAHEACGPGQECTGDGACVKVSPSCVDQPIAGCGTLTIEGGSFRMGWAEASASATWQPVTVDTFVVDGHEVTVARFRRFWNAGHPAPSPIVYPDGRSVEAPYVADAPKTTSDNSAYNWSIEEGSRESYPINRVSWATAFAFCAWDGGRLPTEAEWEYVASGREVDGLKSGRLYSWGDDEPTCALTQALGCPTDTSLSVEELAPVGGVFEIAGNVSEWTADVFQGYGGSCWDGTPRVNPLCWDPKGELHTVRGSSFLSGNHPSIQRVGASGLAASRGIRCVRDPIE
jgi:formylglycine-generating enzyme